MATEKNIENRIRRAFDKLDNSILYKNFDNGYTVSGRPDLSGVYHGVPIAIEVKRGKDGNFKENQLKHLTQWAQAGGISILTCLPNINDVLTNQTVFEQRCVTIKNVYKLRNRSNFAHVVWAKYCPLLVMIDERYHDLFVQCLF